MKQLANFENSGEKIKKLATILWKITIVIACIIVVLFLIMAIELGFGAFLGGLLIGLILLVSGYVSSLLIYGFGELITNTANSKNITETPEDTTFHS
ncbi:MAG: hypothetical protein IJZ32_06060 [Clostridia bacterium]|nr:hypothetical protein [Clostridia bacterium]